MRTLLLGLLFLTGVFAADPTIERLHQESIVVREGVEMPLHLNMVLQIGDEIRTGEGARVYLKLPDGAQVKLGEHTRFKIVDSVDSPKEYKGTFAPFIGAFRYTTGLVNKTRQIDIQLATATLGIRGTDIWGRMGGEEAFVVLIEGSITVQDETQRIILDSSRLAYDAKQKSFRRIDVPQLMEYAQETEIP